MVVPHMGSSASSQGGRGLYFLAGVGALFLGLVGIWLFSLKGPPPAAEASPTQLPGVRTSPFDGIDDDGTVVLQLPSPEQRPIELERAIPTSILVGEPTKVGLFGRQLPGDATVVVEGDHVELVAYEVKSETHIEVELLAKLPSPETVTLTVRNAAGFAAKVTVNITNQ